MPYCYLVRCSDDTLYCGWCNDLQQRISAHNSGRGAKYTRSRRPVELVWYEFLPDKRAAMRREAAVKRLTRQQKEMLIGGMENGNQTS